VLNECNDLDQKGLTRDRTDHFRTMNSATNQLEEASTHKSAKTHAGKGLVTLISDLLFQKYTDF